MAESSESVVPVEESLPEAPSSPTSAKSSQHMLETGWSLWFDKKQSKAAGTQSYRDNLKVIGSFKTIEEFWKFPCFRITFTLSASTRFVCDRQSSQRTPTIMCSERVIYRCGR
jgi:hypothetical protein